MAKVIRAAVESGSEAIHPGYGFLSENAEFAQKVTDAGLVWIGPPPSAIRAMGDKITSRRNMKKAGVPVVPAWSILSRTSRPRSASQRHRLSDRDQAAAGGGGKGIRIVRNEKEMAELFAPRPAKRWRRSGTDACTSSATSKSRATSKCN